MLAFVAIGLSMAGISVAAAAASARPMAPAVLAPARRYVVAPGDSLWSIARSLQPQGDVRPLVHRMEQAYGVNLQVGSVLTLP